MQYFAKTAPLVKFLMPDGSRLKFDRVGENTGVLAVDNAKGMLVVQAIEQGIGGIRQITQDEYLALKKNTQYKGSNREEITKETLLAQRPAPVALPSAPVVPAATVASEPYKGPPPTTDPATIARRPKATKRA